MKHKTHLFWIFFCLLIASFIGAAPGMADEGRLQDLIAQAKAAIARGDGAQEDRLLDEIYALTTGLDPADAEKAEHFSNAERQRKLCPYRKAIDPLLTADDIEYLHHTMRVAAFTIIAKKEANAAYVQAALGCTQDDGAPVPNALALQEGIEWARKLEAADDAETRVLAREYEDLIQHYPDDQLYQWLRFLIDGKSTELRLAEVLEETQQLLNEGILYQARLVEKADRGDLAVQLEVARRLETGDKFEKDHRFAYFWYTRAQQNGGGDAAQSGLDRLHPQLSWLDHELVDMWLTKKHRPY